jgi:hypothetical protein
VLTLCNLSTKPAITSCTHRLVHERKAAEWRFFEQEVGCVEPGGEKFCHHRFSHHRPVKTHLIVKCARQLRERSRVCGACLGLARCSGRMVRRRLWLDGTLRFVVRVVKNRRSRGREGIAPLAEPKATVAPYR